MSPFARQPRQSSLGSDENFSRAIEWLKIAEGSKATVVPSAASTLMGQESPSRLIHVSPHSALRVIDTARLQAADIRYAALSYVWGEDQNFRLLKATKARLTMTMEYGELPKSIQDAVTVTQHLGISYLWVDAL